MAQDAQLISQAGMVESLASDGLVSVSTGAGQPQKNMELAKFADSLGSSVPLQQTSEQVNITGLYARTSDGKMVELTKESVASVMAGLIPLASSKDRGLMASNDTAKKLQNSEPLSQDTVYRIMTMPLYYRNIVVLEFGNFANPTTTMVVLNVDNRGSSAGSSCISGKRISGSGVVYYDFDSNNNMSVYVKLSKGNYPCVSVRSIFTSFYEYPNAIEAVSKDVSTLTVATISDGPFGYNTLAELSSGVAQQMNPEDFRDGVDFNEETTTGHFFARNKHTNSPDNSAWWYVEVLRFVRGSQIYILQRVVRDNNSSMYVRTRTDSGWTGWKQIALS